MSPWVVYRITFSLVKFFGNFYKNDNYAKYGNLARTVLWKNILFEWKITFILISCSDFFFCSWFLHYAIENLPKNNTNFDLKLTLGSSSKSNCIADTFFSVATLVLSAFHSD